MKQGAAGASCPCRAHQSERSCGDCPENGGFQDSSDSSQNQGVASPEILFQKCRMLFGYARVFTDDQNLDLQCRKLKAAGCIQIFEDRATGTRERIGLTRVLKACGDGDVLVVWRLDRLGRSLGHLIELLHDLAVRGVQFRSLSESIDTTTPTGRLTFHLIGALAEFERSLIHERTSVGLKAAKARGVQLGRKPSITAAQAKHARWLINSGENPRSVALSFGIGRTTLYRHLARTQAGVS